MGVCAGVGWDVCLYAWCVRGHRVGWVSVRSVGWDGFVRGRWVGRVCAHRHVNAVGRGWGLHVVYVCWYDVHASVDTGVSVTIDTWVK